MEHAFSGYQALIKKFMRTKTTSTTHQKTT